MLATLHAVHTCVYAKHFSTLSQFCRREVVALEVTVKRLACRNGEQCVFVISFFPCRPCASSVSQSLPRGLQSQLEMFQTVNVGTYACCCYCYIIEFLASFVNSFCACVNIPGLFSHSNSNVAFQIACFCCVSVY